MIVLLNAAIALLVGVPVGGALGGWIATRPRVQRWNVRRAYERSMLDPAMSPDLRASTQRLVDALGDKG